MSYGSREQTRTDHDVGFFDPFLDEKELGKGDLVDKGNEIYFRSVHAFIDAAENAAYSKPSTTIRQNLDKW
ncbi:hypothetical protein W97_02411 [Coniosporium apollinis CBS 100218]|uniref:Uncharacterized protein n=1 Tax=Coniosporium apollinis (strain CBS 100218) TaxID=1168221 RepID=R7YN06_CONA1|nr:uncharacterized protein W97_02411 [Coniosporium apollinis CBS 100218]EON63184.1 hypothetical protein W97_02411 [Coniosporium apollinis CBS 100218]